MNALYVLARSTPRQMIQCTDDRNQVAAHVLGVTDSDHLSVQQNKSIDKPSWMQVGTQFVRGRVLYVLTVTKISTCLYVSPLPRREPVYRDHMDRQ